MSSAWSSSFLKFFILINSKKHLAVASTSAVALCASWKGAENKNSCNSVKVGSLNLPPRPPGSLHNVAVVSVHVSKTSVSSIFDKVFNLWNSHPITFKSKFTLWPIINFDFEMELLNSFKTISNFSPSNSAYRV